MNNKPVNTKNLQWFYIVTTSECQYKLLQSTEEELITSVEKEQKSVTEVMGIRLDFEKWLELYQLKKERAY
jgi:hypothetical protein